MKPALNETHDPHAKSWVETANVPDCDFPIQNLPFGVFRPNGDKGPMRVCTAIGDCVLDISALAALGAPADRAVFESCAAPVLNGLMELGPDAWSALRKALWSFLHQDSPHQVEVAKHLYPATDVEFGLPVVIPNFTDFFASKNHARNAGAIFRPTAPLLPNYEHLPVAYNGRAPSVQIGRGSIQRPNGQLKKPDSPPVFAPSERLDYEVELGFYIGQPSAKGAPLTVDDGWNHVFGVSLLNDWSARDIQAWEYQPLGPFLAKSFATSVSPWIITSEALLPFRQAVAPRDQQDADLLPHLTSLSDQQWGGVDIHTEVSLASSKMRSEHCAPETICATSSSKALYWSIGQMLAHLTSNGSNLTVGELCGSGTLSGQTPQELGSLLEKTLNGSTPLTLTSGEKRSFLEDGDRVILTGRCEKQGFAGIGFGVCEATIAPAARL